MGGEQKSERAGNFVYSTFPPFHFHGRGGWAKRGVCVSSLLAAMYLVCMPADQEGACAEHFFILHFRRSVLTDGVQGEKGVQAASTPSAACLVCMPAGWEATVRDMFFFCTFAVELSRAGCGGGKVVPVSLFSQRRRFWYACQRIERAGPLDIFLFCAPGVQCSRSGGRQVKFSATLYHRKRSVWYAYQRRAHGRHFHLCYRLRICVFICVEKSGE